MIAADALIAPTAQVGERTRIWGLAQVREQAVIGEDCVIGRGAYIGAGVTVGDKVKIQNDALVYEPAVIADGVFIGPAVILTNDHNPRAVTPDGELKSATDWTPVGVAILKGASVGARAVCVAPVTIGRWAMVAAGAVVIRDVPDFALVAGVPARQIGWVGPTGHRLVELEDGSWECPVTAVRFEEDAGTLRELT
ncbi:acyltransferase [Nocardioides sp. Kera G14]|uniref:acyltransferase n=1 Tax=Nocardioides sp. Kera G14 TaxID=2884264 RepID=UPI001D126632|nr:acyltransferase [Nocardioides sp. Kera G14]UDY22537.1 N-acetyltransferase [Nocardioides sp. Kera G14]